MQKTILILLIFISTQGVSQKKWKSLKLGSEGAKYKVELIENEVSRMGGSLLDSSQTKTIFDFEQRIIDRDSNHLFAELKFQDIRFWLSNGMQLPLETKPLGKSAFYRLNSSGGRARFWEQEFTEEELGDLRGLVGGQALIWPFFDMPKSKTRLGMSWKEKHYEKDVEIQCTISGKIDTLGHKCWIVDVNENFETSYFDSLPRYKGVQKSGGELKTELKIHKKFYFNKKSGRLVYGKMKTFTYDDLQHPSMTRYIAYGKRAEVVIVPGKVEGYEREVDKLSKRERRRKKRLEKENTPPIDYDFGEKFGVIFPLQLNKKETNAFQYGNENAFENGYASIKKNGTWVLIDSLGKILPNISSTSLIRCYGELISIADGNGIGLKTLDGKEILPPIFEAIGNLKYGLAAVAKNEESVLLDRTGKEILKRGKYSDVRMSASFLLYEHEGETILRFLKSENFLPKGYVPEKLYGEYLLLAKKGEEEFLFDSKGQLVSKFPIDWIRGLRFQLNKELYKVKFKSGKQKIYKLDNNGSKMMLEEEKYRDDFRYPDSPFYIFQKDEKKGLVDENFEHLVEPDSFYFIQCRDPGCVLQKKDGSFAIVNLAKEYIELPQYKKVGVVYEGFYWGEHNNRVWLSQKGKPFFETNGERFYQPIRFLQDVLITSSYSDLRKENDLISLAGNILSEKSYERINYHSHNDGFLEISKKIENNKTVYGLLHKSGKEIIEPQFDNIVSGEYLKGELFIVVKNRKQGLCDKNGNLILPVEFEEIKINDYNFIWVKKDGKAALLKYKSN